MEREAITVLGAMIEEASPEVAVLVLLVILPLLVVVLASVLLVPLLVTVTSPTTVGRVVGAQVRPVGNGVGVSMRCLSHAPRAEFELLIS
jgi:hypothetical protein